MKLYEELAEHLCKRVSEGYFQVGDKLPSIRQMSKEHNVSISTVQEAYRLLEERQIAEVRTKSGYYIAAPKNIPELPEISRPDQKPVDVSRWEMVTELLNSNEKQETLALGKGTPDVNGQTIKPLIRLISDISRRADVNQLTYDSLQGPEELRRQIARLMIDSGCRLHPDDIVITTGCQEALACSIRSLTKPGDIIAIESPSFYGSMQSIQALDLKALEIPTHPETGIHLDALEMALEQWPIKVLQITPVCNNPLGYTMPDANKQRLMELANQHDLMIIEDDIYGDLTYTYPRPRSIKSFDTQGRVLFCSSFSKTISPSFRIGWCAPGRYLEKVKHMKYVSTTCSPVLQSRAVAEFIAQGYYERHVRKMRTQYLRNRDRVIHWIRQYLPDNIRMSYPQGGFLLWVELPDHIDAVQLNRQLSKHNINIAPGVLFTAAEKYGHCIRINYAQENTDALHDAIQYIGNEVKQQL